MTRSTCYIAIVAAAALLVPTMGCRGKEEQARRDAEREQHWAQKRDKSDDAFPMFDDRPDVARMMNAQAVVGARRDATLHAHHFDGTWLNSLGRNKLALMLHREAGDRPQPIYVDLPEADTLSGERRKTVEKYLEDAGVDLASVEIKTGPNETETHPAAPSIARLRKTETLQGEGGPGATGPGAGTTTTGGFGATATGAER